MALITQSFFCITLICTIITDPKFASNLFTQGGNKFLSYIQCCINASREESAFTAYVNN